MDRDVRVILPAGHASSCNYYRPCLGYVCTSGKVYWRRSGNERVQIENRRKRRRKEARLGKFLDETCQRAYPEETSIHSFGLCGFTRLPTLRPARVYLRCPARPPLDPGLHSLRKVTSKSFPVYFIQRPCILFYSYIKL